MPGLEDPVYGCLDQSNMASSQTFMIYADRAIEDLTGMSVSAGLYLLMRVTIIYLLYLDLNGIIFGHYIDIIITRILFGNFRPEKENKR